MKYRLASKARRDLVDIAAYTFERWGEQQEREYIGGLYRRFEEIAYGTRTIGRPGVGLIPGLRRLGYGSHVLYFRRLGDEIQIVRVLHRRMLPAKHLGP